MKKSKWTDALKTAQKANDKSIYNFIQWRHLLTKGNLASYYEYKSFIDKKSGLLLELYVKPFFTFFDLNLLL